MVRGKGAVLGCVVWETPRVLASEIFRFLLPLMQKPKCCGFQNKRLKSVYLLIHTEIGSSYLTFAADSPRMF